MTLQELCDPLFQFICRLNRIGRSGGSIEKTQTRSEIKALLAEMRSKAATQPGLGEQFEKVRLPLTFFADSMIRNSAVPFAMDWEPIAAEDNEYAGDEKFFDLLQDTLNDRYPAATERLAIFYTCIGLGFTGICTGQPDQLRRRMMECAARLGKQVSADDASPLCPDWSKHVIDIDFVKPPTDSLVGIGIALVGLIIVLFVANVYLYYDSSSGLARTLDALVQKATESKAR